MSQAKVDRYKKDKANRRKMLAKQKKRRTTAIVCVCVAAAALIGWGGYAGYSYYEDNKPAQSFYANTTAISDYLNTLSTETE